MRVNLATQRPVDRLAARVVSAGFPYQPAKNLVQECSPTPLPTRPVPKGGDDLRGLTVGWLTVIGLADKRNRWVVRCRCGRYLHRTAKAIRNPANGADRCELCRHTAYLRRTAFWRENGFNVEETVQ